MSEKIISIADVTVPHKEYRNCTLSGYEVVTDKQRVLLVMDDGQQCCERYGYFWSEDDPQAFVGAELLDVRVTDDARNEAAMKKNDLDPGSQYFDGGVLFVDLVTDRGVLQFVAYNEHNGYYSHDARVESTQIAREERL